MLDEAVLAGASFTRLDEAQLENQLQRLEFTIDGEPDSVASFAIGAIQGQGLRRGLGVVFDDTGRLRHVGAYDGGRTISALDLHPDSLHALFTQGRDMRTGEVYRAGVVETLSPWSDNDAGRAVATRYEDWIREHLEWVLWAAKERGAPPTQAHPEQGMQANLDEKFALVNECHAAFQRGESSSPEIIRKAERAALLERVLLEWFQRQQGGDLPEGRGDLSGSACYLAHLRARGDRAVAATWARRVTRDRDLLHACLRDFRSSAELCLNNALGALMEHQRAEDRGYARRLLGFLDDLAASMATSILPYGCACVAAQLGDPERALRYVELATQRGDDPRHGDVRARMRVDDDLRSLHGLPRFHALVG